MKSEYTVSIYKGDISPLPKRVERENCISGKVVPIHKPGKSHSNSSNYRPIALISCICIGSWSG